MRVQHVEYHGAQWCALVEQGWVTSTVESLHDGTRIAAKAVAAQFADADEDGYCDPYPYERTEILERDARGYWQVVRERVPAVSLCDDDIPF